jgi:nitrile hydratase
MNSVQDIGGLDGFGPVRVELNEPVFHEPWESRVFAMAISRVGTGPVTLDALRHAGESLPPEQILTLSYYQKWLAVREALIISARTLTREEIDAKVQQFAANPDLEVPRREDPALANNIPTILQAGNPVTRSIRRKPRFALGDLVTTRNLNPQGHTRLPRYARNKRGVIAAHHGAHVFPDTNAHGLGENPQHLYTVRIGARELWGDSAEPNECVLVDLWESYLAPDGTRANRSGARRLTAAKAATLKPAARSGKPSRGNAKSTRKKSR